MKAREFIWDVIEATTGARMTTSYIRIGGVRADLHPDFAAAVRKAVAETRKVLKDVHGLLDKNKIFFEQDARRRDHLPGNGGLLRLDGALLALDGTGL